MCFLHRVTFLRDGTWAWGRKKRKRETCKKNQKGLTWDSCRRNWGLAVPLGLELLALSEVCVLLLKKEKRCIKGVSASSPPLVEYQEI